LIISEFSLIYMNIILRFSKYNFFWNIIGNKNITLDYLRIFNLYRYIRPIWIIQSINQFIRSLYNNNNLRKYQFIRLFWGKQLTIEPLRWIISKSVNGLCARLNLLRIPPMGLAAETSDDCLCSSVPFPQQIRKGIGTANKQF
jgi:hypothetical protein